MRLILILSLSILTTPAMAAQKPRMVISTNGGSVAFKNHVRGVSFSQIVSGRRQNLKRKGLTWRPKRSARKFHPHIVPRDTTRVLVAK